MVRLFMAQRLNRYEVTVGTKVTILKASNVFTVGDEYVFKDAKGEVGRYPRRTTSYKRIDDDEEAPPMGCMG